METNLIIIVVLGVLLVAAILAIFLVWGSSSRRIASLESRDESLRKEKDILQSRLLEAQLLSISHKILDFVPLSNAQKLYQIEDNILLNIYF